MPTLTLITPGTFTLPVDFGRPHSRSLGVPLGGAADRRSLSFGNTLLGNSPEFTALEITLTGPTLLADVDIALAIVGAPFDLTVVGLPSVRVNRSFTLPAGEMLAVAGTPRGARAYLCVAGGLLVPRTLGSGSGLRPVRAGDRFEVLASRTDSRFAELPLRLPEAITPLRVLPGSHAAIDPENVYAVAGQSNRMGLRLTGPRVGVSVGELTSEPVCPGTIQVPPDGLPIVLGVDCQTIGGYPRAGQVIRADLDLLGQLRPGSRIRFVPIALAEAEAIDREQRAELHAWCLRLRTVAGSGGGAK